MEKTEIESYSQEEPNAYRGETPTGHYPPYATYGSEYDDEGKQEVIDQTSDIGKMEEQAGTKRGLNARHIQMISLGGAIG
jgi:amino acid permease